eukprot:TRINITY_DN64242_c0_g1_i1.p1 TRINITY_DN64242_c0_g1~~TRINITY_DN64242_c0_g1_i1.p1  ORF type:complete len:269 (-),score=66.82 TRINITY_DN64242_c0_g1_i1:90-824(-)
MAREVGAKYDPARDDEDSLSESEDEVSRGFRGRSVYGALAVFVLCGASFVLGRASVQTGSKADDFSDSYGSSLSDDFDEADLGNYEVAAQVVSQDWRPHPGVNNFDVPADGRMTVYHQTSPQACEGIMKTNFRLGSGGWCGKAVYFAMSPEATRQKAVTDSSGHGCMIEAVVEVGRVHRFNSCGKYNAMTGWKLIGMGYDSIMFEPPERTGDELIIFDTDRIVSKRIIPFKQEWMAKRWYGKPR